MDSDDYEGDGGYENPNAPVQADRYSRDEDDLEPFLAAIYDFKMAVNAAFNEYDQRTTPSNTHGAQVYLTYIHAIQSLWDVKSRPHRLHTRLTAPYDILPADVRKTLQAKLDEIHSANTPEHEFIQNHWTRRLFMECPGSSNTRSFKACTEAQK